MRLRQGSGRTLLGQVTPLAAGLQHVQHAVQYRPKIDAAVPPTTPRRREERLDQPPLLIAQVARVAQFAAIVAVSVLRCPHLGFRHGGDFESQPLHPIQLLLGQALSSTRTGCPRWRPSSFPDSFPLVLGERGSVPC